MCFAIALRGPSGVLTHHSTKIKHTEAAIEHGLRSRHWRGGEEHTFCPSRESNPNRSVGCPRHSFVSSLVRTCCPTLVNRLTFQSMKLRSDMGGRYRHKGAGPTFFLFQTAVFSVLTRCSVISWHRHLRGTCCQYFDSCGNWHPSRHWNELAEGVVHSAISPLCWWHIHMVHWGSPLHQ